MRNILKLEIGKAIKNKLFLLSVLIGCGITLLSFSYNIDIYQSHLSTLKQIEASAGIARNPVSAMFSLFNHWIGGEPFSLGTSIFFLVFPLLVAIPYGWSYCEEKTNGYKRSMVVRSGKTPYFLSKYIAVFLAGGLAMVIPLTFNFSLTAMFFPAVTPDVIYDTAYGVFGGSLMSVLYYSTPFLYVLCYLVIDFVFGGLIACISFGISSFVKYRVVTVIVPLFFLLCIHYSRQLIYTSYETQYKEISPLFFLRPVQSAYSASWLIVLAEMLVLFFITALPIMLWERKREIY
jgi:hypothetical protein